MRITVKIFNHLVKRFIHCYVAGMTASREMDAGLRKALDVAGSGNKLALALGLTRAAVYHWIHSTGKIPAERVVDVEKALGIPRKQLRRDLYEK